MVFFVAPFAVAGYRMYMKKKAEREAHERLAEVDITRVQSTEKASQDDPIETTHDNDQKESTEVVRPIDKFLSFCKKLETRRQEAEERILQQFVNDAIETKRREQSNKQSSASLSSQKTNITKPLEILNTAITVEVQGASHEGDSSPTGTETEEEVSPCHQNNNFRIKRHQSSPSLARQCRPFLHPMMGSAATRMNRPRIASV